MAVERTLEVTNSDVLRTDNALRLLARIAVRYACEQHLLDDLEVKDVEQKTKVLSLRPRSEREKLRPEVGRRAEASCDRVYG